MHCLGNKEILKQYKMAFLCSRQVPAGVVLKCYDWAIAQREAGRCIISGFHSQLEKYVLHYLLKGTQPIILVLARGLKKRIEIELKEALYKNRLLLISPFGEDVKRVTRGTVSWQNWRMKYLSPMPHKAEILKSSLRTFHTQGKQFHPLKLVKRLVF